MRGHSLQGRCLFKPTLQGANLAALPRGEAKVRRAALQDVVFARLYLVNQVVVNSE